MFTNKGQFFIQCFFADLTFSIMIGLNQGAVAQIELKLWENQATKGPRSF